jgi:tetratricopeptide (TPR) repeat protein
VLVVVMATGGGGTSAVSGGGAVEASDTLTAAADTSGSYTELVSRANALYDQGMAAFNGNDPATGEQHFRDAAEVYKAAWDKKPGDPNVGTDYAVALFYRRHHEEGLQQIEIVLKKNPLFQPALLNKGIFLRTESEEAQQRGETDQAAQFLARAEKAFEKAVRINPGSEAGKQAAQLLQEI